LESVGLRNCAISEITLAELVFGAENSDNPEKNHGIVEQFINQLTILPIFDSIRIYVRKNQDSEKKVK
jgi:tRNA(fMet)-specific endonuclease VapC